MFSRTKTGTDELVNRLLERGYDAEGLHGDVSQAQREKILRKFKNRQANILVATDVAARGIDINNLSHVINYSLPQDSESYVHRIGRTGRAGNQGTAITFISPAEMRRFGFLKRDIKADIRKQALPPPQDIVATKRRRIKDELQEIIESDNYADYGDMAAELLAEYAPEVALSALLRLAFRSELDESNYPEIRSFSVDRKGTARLFIAIGRKDGYDVRKLVALIKRECDLPDKHINDIKLGESYSFVSIPFSDAEQAVHKLNALRRGSRPLAEIAQSDAGGKKSRRTPRTEQHTDDDTAEKQSSKRKTSKTDTADRSRRDTAAGQPAKDGNRKSEYDDTGRRQTKKGGQKETLPDKHVSGKRKPDPQNIRPAYVPAEVSNAGVDWSFFEKDGNRWDRPAKGAKQKKR